MTIPKGSAVPTSFIVLCSELPQIAPKDLSSKINANPYEEIRRHYPVEVQATLELASVARSLGSAALYDRKVDGLVLSGLPMEAGTDLQQTAVVGGLKMALPYVDGLAPERLLDLRRRADTAFRAFRQFMAEQVSAAADTSGTPTPTPLLTALQLERRRVEFQAELASIAAGFRKTAGWRSAVLLSGALAAGIAGNVAPLIGLTTGAGVNAISAFKEREAALQRLQTNPYYFVWKAGEIARDLKIAQGRVE